MVQKDTSNMKKLLVISSAPLIITKEENFLYKPYESEMQIWAKHASMSFCCPIWREDRNLLVSGISFPISNTKELIDFNLKSFLGVFNIFYAFIYNSYIIYKEIKSHDHIHLRCPGNMGLIGCIVQVFFPKKKKTAKYAGNWDLNAKQPWSYRLQKWILNNTFLTKNMQVLVYGEWEGSSVNIKPFFTATYAEAEKTAISPRDLNQPLNFVFVGTLSDGKRPLYAVKLIELLVKKGKKTNLSLYGEGGQRSELESYIVKHNLQEYVVLEGNQPKETVLEAYKQAHFLILASKSEGWPKVVAEAMFWGCLPIATRVSCVPSMLDSGNRGLLLDLELQKDTDSIVSIIDNQEVYNQMTQQAMQWSRQYTTEKFDAEIKNLI